MNATPATIWPVIKGTFLPKVSTIGPINSDCTIVTNSAILLALPNSTETSFSDTA